MLDVYTCLLLFFFFFFLLVGWEGEGREWGFGREGNGGLERKGRGEGEVAAKRRDWMDAVTAAVPNERVWGDCFVGFVDAGKAPNEQAIGRAGVGEGDWGGGKTAPVGAAAADSGARQNTLPSAGSAGRDEQEREMAQGAEPMCCTRRAVSVFDIRRGGFRRGDCGWMRLEEQEPDRKSSIGQRQLSDGGSSRSSSSSRRRIRARNR